MQHDTLSGLTAALPSLPKEAVQVRMMRELFTRTRESSLVGVLPVLLIVWSHWEAQPRGQLLGWAAAVLAILCYRVLVAHLFLAQPQAQEARRRRWFWLEWLGAMALAAIWVASLRLLGTGAADALFFLRLIIIVALAAFVLSALGIELRLYGSFLTVMVAGTLLILHQDYAAVIRQLPVVSVGLIVYALMLLVRSRGEQRRTREWVRARLGQRLLLDQLNQTIQQELQMHEALRIKTLELEASNRKLGELATRDGLTGAFRRGHIEGELRRMVKAWERQPGPFSVLMLDIDHFKRVNDENGHAVGDEVLRHLAARAQETLRGSDLFGRWGGEEFIALLPGTALPEALEAAERLRLAVQRMEFTGADGAAFGITVSVGVAQLEPGVSADALCQRADQALYAAKHAGRNRVQAYDSAHRRLAPPPQEPPAGGR